LRAQVLGRVEGETPIRKASAIWNTLRRSLKRVFVGMRESQMQRAQMEIDRYHRRQVGFASSEDVRN
jgi:hypothetical protein